MLTRVLVAVVGIPILLFAFCVAPSWVCAVLLSGFCILGSYELSVCTFGKEKSKKWWILPAIIGTLFIFYSYSNSMDDTVSFETISLAMLFLMGMFLLTLFLCMILEHGRKDAITFQDICICLFAALVIPFSFSTLLQLRMLPYGAGMIMIPLVSALCSDAGALFMGASLGRHKLIERVSPNKTQEGALGGILGGVIGMIFFRIVFFLITEIPLNIIWCVVLGVVGSVFGQIGDLFFSVIKREYGIKDYGKLLPGHGGILDRFDSVLFASPIIYFLVQNIFHLY